MSSVRCRFEPARGSDPRLREHVQVATATRAEDLAFAVDAAQALIEVALESTQTGDAPLRVGADDTEKRGGGMSLRVLPARLFANVDARDARLAHAGGVDAIASAAQIREPTPLGLGLADDACELLGGAGLVDSRSDALGRAKRCFDALRIDGDRAGVVRGDQRAAVAIENATARGRNVHLGEVHAGGARRVRFPVDELNEPDATEQQHEKHEQRAEHAARAGLGRRHHSPSPSAGGGAGLAFHRFVDDRGRKDSELDGPATQRERRLQALTLDQQVVADATLLVTRLMELTVVRSEAVDLTAHGHGVESRDQEDHRRAPQERITHPLFSSPRAASPAANAGWRALRRRRRE